MTVDSALGLGPDLTDYVTRVLRPQYKANNVSIVILDDEPCPVGAGTPAWWDPSTKTIHIDLAAVGMDPKADSMSHLDLRDLLVGFVTHEASHSAWSRIESMPEGTTKAEWAIMEMFEEIRIEFRATNAYFPSANDLRRSFGWLLRRLAVQLSERETPQTALELAHTWALVVGRRHARVATLDEIRDVDLAARAVFGDEQVDMMTDILGRATTAESIDEVRVCAQLWLALFPSEDGGAESSMVLHAAAAFPEEGTEDDSGGGDDDGDDTDESEGDVASGDHGKTDGEADEMIILAIERMAGEMAEDLAEVVETANAAEAAKTVFGTTPPWREVEPSATLRRNALTMSRVFERLSLPAISLQHVPSEAPPGRLRGREMVRQGADRAQGRMTTATPWRATKRQHSHTKPIVVGTMTDTSGSMSWAMQFGADFAWVMSTAGHRVGARTAAVTFGEKASMITRPGEIPQKVRVLPANGGWEAFDQAAAALDGVLHLSIKTRAAKVLFIVSDGHLVESGEPERARIWLDRFIAAGTIAVWVNCRSQEAYARKGLIFLDVDQKNPDISSLEAELIRQVNATATA